LKGLVGFENNFNGTTFHHHFCLKTGVSRNGLSLGYSERDTSTVLAYSIILGRVKSFLNLPCLHQKITVKGIQDKNSVS
jgi:hypothetical protein